MEHSPKIMITVPIVDVIYAVLGILAWAWTPKVSIIMSFQAIFSAVLCYFTHTFGL